MTGKDRETRSFFVMGFSLLSMSEFFVFRKMETCETKNHPLCGCESRSYTKSPFRFIIEVSKPLSKKGKVIYMAKKANDLAHTKWMCKYHIVFTPKYRRKVIYNQYKEDIRHDIRMNCFPSSFSKCLVFKNLIPVPKTPLGSY